MIRILSLGAGVQSSCVLLMSCAGVLPKLDAAVFADTQWEPADVYRQLDYLVAQGAKAGIPVHRVTAGNLRDEAMAHFAGEAKAFPRMPLFLKNPDGTKGFIHRQCTQDYKIEPVERFVRSELLGLQPRQRWPKVPTVEMWFGISDEEFGARGRISQKPWCVNRYPLVHDVVSPRRGNLFARGFDRADCLAWMADNGHPPAPRSACIGCPFHSDDEWARIRAIQSAWADAVEFDRALRARPSSYWRGEAFLHPSLVPLADVVLRGDVAAGDVGMRQECRGVCGV